MEISDRVAALLRLTKNERTVLTLVRRVPRSVQSLIRESRLPAASVHTSIASLKERGLVRAGTVETNRVYASLNVFVVERVRALRL